MSTADSIGISITVILSQALGDALVAAIERRIRRARHDKLERMVAAELLARGVSFDSMMLQQLSDNVPPRVTPEVVQKVADRIEAFMKLTGGTGGIFDQSM